MAAFKQPVNGAIWSVWRKLGLKHIIFAVYRSLSCSHQCWISFHLIVLASQAEQHCHCIGFGIWRRAWYLFRFVRSCSLSISHAGESWSKEGVKQSTDSTQHSRPSDLETALLPWEMSMATQTHTKMQAKHQVNTSKIPGNKHRKMKTCQQIRKNEYTLDN